LRLVLVWALSYAGQPDFLLQPVDSVPVKTSKLQNNINQILCFMLYNFLHTTLITRLKGMPLKGYFLWNARIFWLWQVFLPINAWFSWTQPLNLSHLS